MRIIKYSLLLMVIGAYVSTLSSAQTRPQPTVDDLFNQIGRCQIDVTIRDKYVQQLEAMNALLKKENDELKAKPPDATIPQAK